MSGLFAFVMMDLWWVSGWVGEHWTVLGELLAQAPAPHSMHPPCASSV